MADTTQAQRDALQDALDNNDILEFYTLLESYGDPYGRLGKEVTANDTAQGQLANNFAAAGAEDNGVDLSYNSDDWKALNKDLAESYMEVLTQNGGDFLSWDQVRDIHHEAYDELNLDRNDWFPNLLLERSSDPAALWDDWMTNDGWLDVLEDGWNDVVLNSGLEDWIPIAKNLDVLFGDARDPDELNFASNFVKAFSKTAPSVIADFVADAPALAASINDYLASGVSELIIEIQNLMQAASDWSVNALLETMFDQLASTFDPTASLDDNIAPLSDLFDALQDAADGLADWVDSMMNPDATDREPEEWLEDALKAFLKAIGISSPLVFDLDGDGIELVSLENSGVYWDLDEDGYSEVSGWVAADDGFLAIDLDGDGQITDHSELFGSLTEDGFSVLATYDTNSDDIIDSNDTQFNDLLVWQDVNQNGISESTELYSLADLDIVSIDLGATVVSQTNQGHEISHISTYTVDDGVSGAQTFDIVDVWFQYDDTNSVYTEEYQLSIEALTVATARGYGLLPDLHISISQDNDLTDSSSLASLMNSFEDKTFAEFFDDSGIVMGEVRAIMYRWAGVDDVDPTSRGQYADAQELEFLEKLMGVPFLQVGSFEDPQVLAADALEEAFFVAQKGIAATLIAQSVAGELFDGNPVYDILHGNFEGITGIKQTGLDTLLTKSQDTSQVTNKLEFWSDVVRVIDGAKDINTYPGADLIALETAITTSDSTLSLQDVLENLEYGTVTGTTYTGTSGDDVLYGDVGDDGLNGNAGNDELYGGFGDDVLNGKAGDDILNGQSGNDTIYGDNGNDTYLYTAGQGDDIFQENNTGTDKILFDEGIAFTDLTLTRINNYDLLIEVDSSIGGGSITINSQFRNGTSGIFEELEFADSTVVDLSTIQYTLTGTSAGETLWGVRYGGSQDDIIYGMGGDDTIRGYSSTPDYGDNFLYGGDGDDTIIGALGVDYIEGGNGADDLKGYNGNDEIYGQAGNDILRGQNQDDYLDGGAGDDTIYGDNHNDILIGGLGQDSLTGGAGNDIFAFKNGESFDAVDTITDYNASNDAIDISDLLSGYDPLTDTITDFVQITDDGTDSTLAVDADGGADNFIAIATILNEIAMTDEAALEASGKLITAV